MISTEQAPPPEVWAVIPSYARRAEVCELAADLIAAGAHPIIIDNGYEPPLRTQEAMPAGVVLIRIPGPPNLSALWNVGIGWALVHGEPDAVLIMNDDCGIETRTVQGLIGALLAEDTAAAFPSQTGATYRLDRPGGVALDRRMTGWCFAIAGDVLRQGFTFDEQFEWWYGDDDADWRLRQLGGVLAVPAPGIRHTDPNGWQHTDRGEVLQGKADADRERFRDKWGSVPW